MTSEHSVSRDFTAVWYQRDATRTMRHLMSDNDQMDLYLTDAQLPLVGRRMSLLAAVPRPILLQWLQPPPLLLSLLRALAPMRKTVRRADHSMQRGVLWQILLRRMHYFKDRNGQSNAA